MTAATEARNTVQFGTGPFPVTLNFPVAEDAVIYEGTLVAINADGYAVPASADSTLTVVGVAATSYGTVDNTGGADGDLTVNVFQGVFWLANGNSLTLANVGDTVYVVDDQTVSGSSSGGARPIAGSVYKVDSVKGVAVAVGLFPAFGGFNPASALALSAEYQKTTDGAANTATTEFVFARVNLASTVSKIYYTPTGTLTADDTNYATITVATRDGEGGGATTLKAVTTKITGGTGDWSAFTSVDFGTLSSAAVDAGGVLTLTIAKSGSGVAVPGGVLTVVYAAS